MDTMTTIEKTSQLPTLPLTVKRRMVAERIIEAREQKGWSRRDLAFHAQISDKTVERLEEAKVDKPRGSTLRKIAEATGREVVDLRPDMAREEKDLRAQLDRIEKVVLLLLSQSGVDLGPHGELRQALLDALPKPAVPPAPGKTGSGRRRRPA
jgi:transcriptional regulator with XRE-family HTH domain